MVELGTPAVTLPKEEEMPVRHRDLLRKPLLRGSEPLIELLSLLGVEPSKAVLIALEVPQRRKSRPNSPSPSPAHQRRSAWRRSC